jgi:hypothetical protein
MNLSISNLPKLQIKDLKTSGPIVISCTQCMDTTTCQHDQLSQDSKTLPQVWESVERNKPQTLRVWILTLWISTYLKLLIQGLEDQRLGPSLDHIKGFEK